MNVRTDSVVAERYRGIMRHSSEMPNDPVIVVTNPYDDVSPAAFHALLDDILAGPEPDLDSIGAAEVVREIRAGSDE